MALLPTRLRQTEGIRDLIRENRLTIDDFIYPLFIAEGLTGKEAIPSMPGQYRIGLDVLKSEIEEIRERGLKAVLLFGIPGEKDETGSKAYDNAGIIQRSIREIKLIDPKMIVITDVCLCEYKKDGHCCFFTQSGLIDREKTLKYLSQTALSHVQAGADIVAPSDMMDGHVRAIREVLDSEGYEHIPIMGYSAKYCSSFYGPFREAADSAPRFGNRRAYQMDPANVREALLEIRQDLDEGVDMIMVKPALSYLDIIARANEISDRPVVAYQVSGEYTMLKEAVEKGILEELVIYETLLSIKRAGADLIISYFAKDIPQLLKRYQPS